MWLRDFARALRLWVLFYLLVASVSAAALFIDQEASLAVSVVFTLPWAMLDLSLRGALLGALANSMMFSATWATARKHR